MNANNHYTNFVVPRRRGPRNPRPATWGVLLDNMTRAMEHRLSIKVDEGKKRPREPIQAAKFASEASVIIKSRVPIFTHWKEYKKETEQFDHFVDKLVVSALSLLNYVEHYCS